MLPKRRQPTHPGTILLKEFLEPLQLSPKQFALEQKIDEAKLQAIINGKEGVSEKIAEQLAAAFNVPAQFWKHLQEIHNRWSAQKSGNLKKTG